MFRNCFSILLISHRWHVYVYPTHSTHSLLTITYWQRSKHKCPKEQRKSHSGISALLWFVCLKLPTSPLANQHSESPICAMRASPKCFKNHHHPSDWWIQELWVIIQISQNPKYCQSDSANQIGRLPGCSHCHYPRPLDSEIKYILWSNICGCISYRHYTLVGIPLRTVLENQDLKIDLALSSRSSKTAQTDWFLPPESRLTLNPSN